MLTVCRFDTFSCRFSLLIKFIKIKTSNCIADYKCCEVRLGKCLRPYHVENTGSRPITEVKQRRARLVLGWVTAWEYRVL